MTVAENMGFALKMAKVSKEERTQKVREVAELTWSRRFVGALSQRDVGWTTTTCCYRSCDCAKTKKSFVLMNPCPIGRQSTQSTAS